MYNYVDKLSKTKSSIKTNTRTEEIIRVEVVFGVWKQNCKGVGICRVVPYNGLSDQSECRKAVALLSRSSDRRLKFSFLKQNLCTQVIENYFRHGVFRLEEDFRIPSFIEEALFIGQKFVWKGEYPITEEDNCLIVRF